MEKTNIETKTMDLSAIQTALRENKLGNGGCGRSVPLESRDGFKCGPASQSSGANCTNREDALQCARQRAEAGQDKCQRWLSGLDRAFAAKCGRSS